MLVPQIVVSKRLRRQLKNGEMPDTIAAMGLFEESKESPRPTRPMFSSPGSSIASPSPSPPLEDDEDNTPQYTSEKRVRFERVKVSHDEKKLTIRKNGSSSASPSPPSQNSSSSTNSKKRPRNHSSLKSSSSQLPSQEITPADLRHSLVAFTTISLLILLLLLGDQEVFTQLYRQMSPPPVNYNLIPSAERFYDSRILSTGILSPLDNQLTNDSVLRWWVDGAFLSPGGDARRRNMTLRVFFNEQEVKFPNGNTVEIEFQGRLQLQVDLAKYGLGDWNVNGSMISGADEVILEVNFDPLPTDAFFSQTNNGRRLLSATASTTFYFVPPAMAARLSTDPEPGAGSGTGLEAKPKAVAGSGDDNQDSDRAAVREMEEQPGQLADSSTPLPSSPLSAIVNLHRNQDQDLPLAQPIVIPDRHTALKAVHLQSEGGCNEQIGTSILRLTASLSHSLLTSDPSSPFGFGEAVVVLGEEIFPLSRLIFDQTAAQPYRVIPAPQGHQGQQSYSAKNVSILIHGLSRHSMHFVQVFFCKDKFLLMDETHRECIRNPYAWDTAVAMCV